jgi:hypothetical protein
MEVGLLPLRPQGHHAPEESVSCTEVTAFSAAWELRGRSGHQRESTPALIWLRPQPVGC